MQSTNNPYNKSMLIAGILTIFLGIILGVITIMINLSKYINNINQYTVENKYTIESQMLENDNNYNAYVSETKSLNEDKQLYQKELAGLKNNFDSNEYKELEQKIKSINTRLEELEQLKYSSLTEKNKLRKEYTMVLKVLDEKESAKSLVKCYLVGFAIIIVTINVGAYFIHLAYKPDADDVILKNQIKINKEYEEKLLQLQKHTIDTTNENKESLKQPEVISKTKNKPKNNNSQSSKKKTSNNYNRTYNRNSSSRTNTSNKKNTTK